METQVTPISVTRSKNAQHLMLLLALLTLIWTLVSAPQLLAAPAIEKPIIPSEKTIPKTDKSAQININTADAATLAGGLDGIGLKKAEAIIAHREQNGKFTSVDQLLDVKGIGEATLEKNRAKITL